MTSAAPHTAESGDFTSTARPGRRLVDAPVRAFHWLFALSFLIAWLTAESEHWRAVHITMGYAFGGLLVLRVLYGLIGPKQARLSSWTRRLGAWPAWWSSAREGKVDIKRLATLGMGASVVLMMLLTVPLVLSGYGNHMDWLNDSDLLEELHELLANGTLALILGHVALVALLSVLRGKNMAQPMLTGRAPEPGPDLARANRGWTALVLVLLYAGFVGGLLSQDGGLGLNPPNADNHLQAVEHGLGGDHDDDEDD
jgi:cytochrome b